MAKDDENLEGLQDDEETLFPEEGDFEDFNLDEDLHFEEESSNISSDTSDASAAEAPQVSGSKSSMFLPIVIGTVLLGFVGWKLFELLGGTTPPPEEVTIAANQSKAPKQNLTPEQIVALTSGQQPDNPTDMPKATEQQPAASDPQKPMATPEQANENQNINQLAEQFTEQDGISPQEQAETFSVLTNELYPTQQTDRELRSFEAEINESLEQLKKSLKSRDDNVNKINKSVTDLDNKIDVIGRGLGKLIKKIDNFQGSVSKLNKEVSYLSNQEKMREQARKQQAQKRKAATSAAKLDHHFKIEATIPGRAWLKNKDGHTITVSEGDTLGELGKILIIDPYKSAVVTSSGVVIR